MAAAVPGIPDFELVRVVGRGSYGDVWLARGITGAWRAIKVVWRDRFTNAEPFEREFRGLKEFADVSLDEASQLTLLHVGRNDAAGFFYYVMELADDVERGRQIDPESYVPLTLAEMRTRRGRIPANECAGFGAAIARGLASLHRRGLVHRDVKPSNIILVSGVPKLADVGLVAPSASAHTFVGTEGYVPPEGPGAPSADVFALAKVLYELSTGHDRQEFPKLPADLARLPDRAALLELNEIFLHGCGPTRAERYRDGSAILAELTALNAGVSLRTRRLAGIALRAIAVAVLLGLAGGGIWRWTQHRGPAARRADEVSRTSVAVLPFLNLSGNSAQDHVSDRLSEGILNALDREPSVQVAKGDASFSSKEQNVPAGEIAKRLRVAQLIQGSVQQVGSRLQVDVQLTNASNGVTENLGTFDHDIKDLLVLQHKVAAAVVARLAPRAPPPVVLTTNPDAYDAYQRGRALHVRSAASAPEAVKFYERAVELDPNFAVAWARLADARFRTPGAKEDGGARVWEALNRALELEPNLPLALSLRGMLRSVQRDFEGAARDFARADAMQAPTADSLMYRIRTARDAGDRMGIVPMARAAMSADPENGMYSQRLARIFDTLGEFPDADRLHQRASVIAGPTDTSSFKDRILVRQRWRGGEAALRLIDQAPPNQAPSRDIRAQILLGLGRIADARAVLEGWEGTLGSSLTFADAGLMEPARKLATKELAQADADIAARKRSTTNRILRAKAQFVLGNRDAAVAELEAAQEDIERVPNIFTRWSDLGPVVTRLYARFGESDIAIARIRAAIAEGFPFGYELRDSVFYAGLRSDPRFQQLMAESIAWAAALPDPPDNPAVSGR